MSARNQQWLKWFIGFILVAAAAYAGVSLPAIQTPADVAIGAQAYTNFTGLVVEVPTTFATATPGVVINSAGLGKILDIQDAGTPVASILDGGALTLSYGAFTPSFANLTVTDGYTLTPAYTTYALDTAGAVTITLAASANEGQLLILINDDANATIIADTNLRSSDGAAITLAGAYDIAIFVYQDSEWLLLATTANS